MRLRSDLDHGYAGGMKPSQWLCLGALLLPLGGCQDSSGGDPDPFADATVVEVSQPADDSGVTVSQDSSVTDLPGQVSSEVAPTDAGQAETKPADGTLADAGAPDVPTPQDASAPPDVPLNLTGQDPPTPQALPSLAGVVDSTGSPVLEDQLKDHWSVLWFYPLASTSG